MFHRYIVLILGLVLFACSCSGGNSVTAPATNPADDLTAERTPSYHSHNLWGYWTVSIDSENLTAEAVPVRGVQFTCNVTQFLQPPLSPVHMLSFAILPSSDPATGFFDVDVTLRHPFPGLPYYRGFDVRGIFISDGSYTTGHDPSAVYAGEGDSVLLNADGLSRWWNPTEFTSYDTIFGYTRGKLAPDVLPTATLNGYKYFAHALSHDQQVWEMDPDTRGSFPVTPGVYTRPYSIQFAMNGPQVDFTFNYAVDASWAEPDESGFPEYPVDSYALSANSTEPYCIRVEDNNSTAYYVDEEDNGGSLNLHLYVYDWQSVDNPDGVSGEISAIWLESPVLNDPVDVLPDATVLPDGPTSSIYEVSLGSLNLTKSGPEPLLVFAEASDPFGYEPQVPGGSAFDYPSAPLGAYLMSSVIIKSEGQQAPIVESIDPDNGMSGEQLTGVIVTGQYFQSGAQVELRHPDWDPIEADNEATSSGGTSITCDIDLDLAAQGDWDVVVINPDLMEGVLEDGFHVVCADGVHEYEGKHYLLDYAMWNYCQRGDLTIMETGEYAGECIVKRSYNTTTYAPGTYVRFDPDSPEDVQDYDYFTVDGRRDGINAYITMTASIDQNPVNGHIGVVNGRMFDYVQIVDDQGTFVEEIQIPGTGDTYPDRYPVIPAVDFDAEGDMWLIVDIRGEWHPPHTHYDPIWELRHYELQESSPYYVENESDRLDISEDLYLPDAEPYGHMWYIADIAISYTEDLLFVFASNIQGSNRSMFVKYDISQSPPEWVDDSDLIPALVTCSNPYSGISRADIEFDHADLSAENCRLLVMYQIWDGSEVQAKLMRLDTDMNVLADEIVGDGFGSWDNPHAIAINVDTDLRNLIAIDMASSAPLNDFGYFDMPSTGWW